MLDLEEWEPEDRLDRPWFAPMDDYSLAVLNSAPNGELSASELVVKLRQVERFSRYVDAQRIEVLAAIAGPAPVECPRERLDDFSSHEVAVASLCSVYAADHQVWLARDLTSRLTRTTEAMQCGEISMAQARALSPRRPRQLDVGIAREVEDRMLTFSHRQNLSLFKAALRRWVAKLDPDFTEKATEARRQVEVSHTAFDDGTGQLYLRGPLELTTTVHMALTAAAAKTKAMLGGTVAQRKLAALRDWAKPRGTHPTPRASTAGCRT